MGMGFRTFATAATCTLIWASHAPLAFGSEDEECFEGASHHKPDPTQEYCAKPGGVRHGRSTRWYRNGQTKSVGDYRDGQSVGTSTIWYETGQKKQESSWETNQKQVGGKGTYVTC